VLAFETWRSVFHAVLGPELLASWGSGSPLYTVGRMAFVRRLEAPLVCVPIDFSRGVDARRLGAHVEDT